VGRDSHEVRRRRACAQRLRGDSAGSVVETVRELLAVQAQDFDSARLALRARRPGLDPAAIDRALSERQLVVSWLCRGTLHLVCADDFPWLLSLVAPRQLRANQRRLAQEGVSADNAEVAVGVIERALAERGPMTRAELRALIAEAGVRSEGQALVHLLILAALNGRIVRCDRDRFALVADWLPQTAPIERDAALRELGLRYRQAHALAEPHDLAWWAGVSVGDARRAWRDTTEPRTEASPLPAKLLASFDEYLMGWKDRSPVLPEALKPQVLVGGIIRAVAVNDGQVVDTWTKPGGHVRLSTGTDDGFNAEARDVERFLAHGAAP
jgi:hypothetical protein